MFVPPKVITYLQRKSRGSRGYLRRPRDGRPPETARTDWERKRAGVAFLIGHSCLTVPDFGSVPAPWQTPGFSGMRRWLHIFPSFLTLARISHTAQTPVSGALGSGG